MSWSNETDWCDEETDNPLCADERNFYKLEKWTKDDTSVDRLFYARNNLDKHKRRIRLDDQAKALAGIGNACQWRGVERAAWRTMSYCSFQPIAEKMRAHGFLSDLQTRSGGSPRQGRRR